MRNTQLDSSVPRRRAPGPPGGVLPVGAPVPIRYFPPVLATLGAALVLVVVFGLLAYLAFDITTTLAAETGDGSTTSPISPLACGIGFVLLLFATLYFANAVRLAGLDVRAQPVTLDGSIMQRHTGRGRNGGFWIVVAPGSAVAPAPVDEPPRDPPGVSAWDRDRDSTVATRPKGFVRGSTAFAAQLQDVTPVPAAPEPALPAEKQAAGRRRLEAGEVNLRVDKHIYHALAVGDAVQVVYSRHLQHVFYVRKQSAAGEPVILRNLALL